MSAADEGSAGSDRVIHLHQRSLLRIWLVTQVMIQAVFYAAFVSMLAAGLEQPGYLVGGVLGLAGVAGFATVRGYLLLQPPLTIDLDDRMIEARSGSLARARLPFDVAERMELRTGIIHQLYLAATGPDSGPKRFRLNLTRGGRRSDDGEHELADVLPTPLRQLSDGVVITDRPTWGEAARLACFLGLGRVWRGRPPRSASLLDADTATDADT